MTCHRFLALVPTVVCPVCHGAGLMRLARFNGRRWLVRMACPQCQGGKHPIPILTLPYRRDIPSGDPR